MNTPASKQSENLVLDTNQGFTPAMLAERRPTLGDLPPSQYDHETQTRVFREGEAAPDMAPDTLFDGEKS